MSRVAFCSTCKGRLQHLQVTLPKNMEDNPSAKFILLDYADQAGLLNYLKANFSQSIESGRLSVYSIKPPKTFHMAHAKNMSHRLGILEGCNYLVNIDADNFAGYRFDEYIASNLNYSNFLWAKMIKEGPDRLPRGISGRIAITDQSFLKVGGYDERFDTWGPDDRDFNIRLQRLGYHDKEIDKKYLGAIRHTDKMRFKEYQHAATSELHELEAVHTSDATVANFGNIGCGVVYKNFNFDNPINLDPLPTRIFGIGMHKTATSSLNAALKILGFDSAHWQNAHWAKAIWNEMSNDGHSITLEKHYALCDLPIPLLFKELDKYYKGSKFILTLRDENSWLESVRNHWSYEHNKFRAAWDTDPVTHKMHRALYNQKHFNAEVFLARYRRHNDEVKQYFQSRPNDLLVLDIQSWEPLCKFLSKSIPDAQYPKFNITNKSEV